MKIVISAVSAQAALILVKELRGFEFTHTVISETTVNVEITDDQIAQFDRLYRHSILLTSRSKQEVVTLVAAITVTSNLYIN